MFALVLLLSVASSLAGKLPKDTVVCSRKHPNIHECVRDAIQKSLPHFLNGVPDLGVESLDPFNIKDLVIDKKKNNGSPVDIDLSWNDVTITGIKNAKITSAKADWDNDLVSFEATLSEPIDIKGQYKVDGVILILPIKGFGKFDCKLEGFKAHIKVHGKKTKKDGVDYMEVDRLAFTFDVDHMTMEYDNLFNGDPVLGATMNSFINENWRDILDEMKTSVEATFSSHFQEVAEKVFNQVPIGDIATE